MTNPSALRLLGAVLAMPLALVAQDEQGSIRGVVRDKDFDVPLGGAEITVLELARKTTSADLGNYVFNELPPGRYTLVFAKDGYVRQVKGDVVVTARILTEVDAALSGDFTEMEEFVVQEALQLGGSSETALQQLRLESPAMMDSIGAEFMSRSGASDAAGALRLVAGASVADGKSAVIRGLPDRYVSSQLNGLRLPTADEDKRAVELDQFPAEVLESIQVSKTFTPDQQGDASGGAVDVRLKGIPDEPFFVKVKGQVGGNTQVPGRGSFLTYDGGGVSTLGRDGGSRDPQTDKLGQNWDGAAGVAYGDAPIDRKFSVAIGGKERLTNDLKVGFFTDVFYERESSAYDDGIDDSWWVTQPGQGMTPKTSQGSPQDGNFKTSLFDVVQGKTSVQWGGLGVLGLETENHALSLAFLHTLTTEDSATLAEDTRGKAYFHPGHDPNDPNTPGHDQLDGAPYLRLETLEYTERGTDTLQLRGRHTLPSLSFAIFEAPEFDWSLARSSADLDQPDKRQFGSSWRPGRVVGPVRVPARYAPYKPSANFSLGNFQRIWKKIEEESSQGTANLKLPFDVWEGDADGYLKFGVFADRLERDFDQDTYSNFNDNSGYIGEFDRFWSGSFPFENHPITASEFDVDYHGELDITAWYLMADLPLLPNLNLIGGVRSESTRIGIVNDPESLATWFPPGSLSPTQLNPGDADVAFEQDDVLPALGLVFEPVETLTLRASWSKTVARQTFKELTPILQQEYLGGPVFIGNPALEMSSLENLDLRADWAPYDGGLVSLSWFRKDIERPIEYVQRLATFDFTAPVNYPKGELSGVEIEVRQTLSRFVDALDGFAVGANATFIHSEVTLPADEAAGFRAPGILAPMDSRDMTNAPEHLYNLFLTYDLDATGTRFSLFYTIQGDTLVAGAGQSAGNLVPNVYTLEYGTLNASVTQPINRWVNLQLQAKNLTDPDIQQVYRSPYIGGDVLKTAYSQGIDYSIAIGGEIRF